MTDVPLGEVILLRGSRHTEEVMVAMVNWGMVVGVVVGMEGGLGLEDAGRREYPAEVTREL